MSHTLNVREYTHQLLKLVEEGAIDKDVLIKACVCWMSEDDVRKMMLVNDFIGKELDWLSQGVRLMDGCGSAEDCY